MEERAPDCCQDRRSFDQNCGSRDRRRPAVNASRLFALSSSYDGEQLCMNSRFAKYNGRFPKMFSLSLGSENRIDCRRSLLRPHCK